MEFNATQFRQPAFRGFGDQAMRRHRGTPAAPTSAPTTPRAPSNGHQSALFQAADVRSHTPRPPFNSAQFRTAQHALPGMSTPAMRSQRVTPPPAPPAAAPAPATSGPGWHQPPLSGLGPTPSSASSPSAAGPAPTRWPAPAAAPSAPTPSGSGRTVTINATAYRHAGPSRPATTAQAVPRAAPSPAPARPTTPPTADRSPAPATSRGDLAAPLASMAIGPLSQSFQSIDSIARDPKKSGNPLFKTSEGWSKS